MQSASPPDPSEQVPAERAPADHNPADHKPVDHTRLQTILLGTIAFGIIMFLLVQARFLLITLVIAIILFSLTSDAINWVARFRVGAFRIPPGLASVVALLLIASGLLTLSGIVLSELNTVVVTVVQYAEPAQRAMAELFSWMGADVEAAVLASIQQVPVGEYARALAAQAGDLISATIMVILFVGFLFVERIWFSTKLTSLMGDSESAERAELIIGSIIRRINRYLLVKTVVSAVTGLMVFAVMSAFGLELATATGIITFLLNYIPNVGSIVATIIAALIAYVQTGDVALTLALLAVVTVVQFGNGSIIDPMLMGKALRLSSFGILLSLAFWGAVWGVPGMFLSVPIMVALMIVCSHIPGFRPVAVLLSREGLPDTELDPPHARPGGDRDDDAPGARRQRGMNDAA